MIVLGQYESSQKVLWRTSSECNFCNHKSSKNHYQGLFRSYTDLAAAHLSNLVSCRSSIILLLATRPSNFKIKSIFGSCSNPGNVSYPRIAKMIDFVDVSPQGFRSTERKKVGRVAWFGFLPFTGIIRLPKIVSCCYFFCSGPIISLSVENQWCLIIAATSKRRYRRRHRRRRCRRRQIECQEFNSWASLSMVWWDSANWQGCHHHHHLGLLFIEASRLKNCCHCGTSIWSNRHFWSNVFLESWGRRSKRGTTFLNSPQTNF